MLKSEGVYSMSTSLLDVITRIYKNAAGGIIGIYHISIDVRFPASSSHIPGKISDGRFKRTSKRTVNLEVFNLVMGESRVIDEISMTGKYDDFTYNGTNTDIVSVTYTGNAQTNDLTIGMNDLPTIGDTI